MSSVAALQPEPAPITACTISRDVSNFDLLIEDMEAELGESWGDLTFDDAIVFLGQPDSKALEFVAIAVDAQDESDLARISGIWHWGRRAPMAWSRQSLCRCADSQKPSALAPGTAPIWHWDFAPSARLCSRIGGHR